MPRTEHICSVWLQACADYTKVYSDSRLNTSVKAIAARTGLVDLLHGYFPGNSVTFCTTHVRQVMSMKKRLEKITVHNNCLI